MALFLFFYINGRAVPLNANCARLNVISRDLLGAATSCETPPARASRTLPLQRKTQWSPDQFYISISFNPPLEKKKQQQHSYRNSAQSAIYLKRNRAAQRCGSRFAL